MNSQTNKDFGVLYFVAERPYYVWEAVFSAVSFKQRNPTFPIALSTEFKVGGEIEGLFDVIMHKEPKTRQETHHPYSRKVECLLASPFSETLFLDADTFVSGSLDELIDGPWERMRLCPALVVSDAGTISHAKRGSSELFNTGVVCFGAGQRTELEAWRDACLVREADFRVPTSSDARPISVGDQNVFNDLAIKDNWQISAIDAFRFNLKHNVLRVIERDTDAISRAKIFHLHEAWRNLAHLGLEGFDRTMQEFRRIKYGSTVAEAA